MCIRDRYKGAEVRRYEKTHGVFERKILRRIYAPLWDGEMWKIGKNRELRDLYGEADIVRQ